MTVAPARTLPQRWQVGGEESEITIFSRLTDTREREAEENRAATLLSANGFAMAKTPDGLPSMPQGISDREIERANALLAGAGIRAGVAAYVHHSTNLIYRRLAHDIVALLDDPHAPYLVAFKPGWGGGDYEWYALESGGKVMGFVSEMIAPADIVKFAR